MSSVASKPVLPVWWGSHAKDLTLPAILEFQSPSTTIINAPTPRSAQGIVWIITSLVCVLIAITGLIPIDRVVTARGLVVSQTPTILVQPLETAIVRSINVREGQRVNAGELLATLDSTFASADVAALATQVSAFEAEAARLRAEAQGKPFEYSGTDPAWLLQAALSAHRLAEYDAKLDNFRHRGDELAALILRSQSDVNGYRERLQVAQSIEEMRKQLEAMQAGSKMQSLLATDNRAEMARSLANAEQTGEGAKRDQAALAAERNGYMQGWHAEASQKLAEVSSRLNDAREQLSKAKLRRQLVELRSDREAIVQSVAKVSEGSVLQSGQHFVTLVPVDAPLEIESNVFGSERGFVQVGNSVMIKFDTFPYAQYGLGEGKVRIISPDSFTAAQENRNPTSSVPTPTTITEPYYRSRITIDRLNLHDVPDDFHVTPGMPVTTDIKVGKRTVLGYLLGMVIPIGREALREP